MRVVWKYKINPEIEMEIMLPKRAVILSVQAQENVPMMWVIVDPDEKEHEVRKFKIVATGQNFELKQGMVYHGMFQVDEGSPLVFHVFEDAITIT